MLYTPFQLAIGVFIYALFKQEPSIDFFDDRLKSKLLTTLNKDELNSKLTEIRNILNEGIFNCVEEVKINDELKRKY